MIYEFPPSTAPIRQGDIFVGLPRIDLSLRRLLVVEENRENPTVIPWRELAANTEAISAIVGIAPVAAIVATQDCDNVHEKNVTLCEIREFRDVERLSKDTQATKSWVSIITRQARLNLKWFYLPPDERLGFREKMGVDFTVTLRVQRVELEELRSLRTGRLNPLADEHFRERISEFFRRYPYDEWYPLDSDELADYRRRYPDATPFEWQIPREG